MSCIEYPNGGNVLFVVPLDYVFNVNDAYSVWVLYVTGRITGYSPNGGDYMLQIKFLFPSFEQQPFSLIVLEVLTMSCF